MSADLPDTLPASSVAMARLLVQTMRCDRAVLQRLREDFDNPPPLRTIADIRARVKRRKAPEEPFKAHEGYRPSEAADRAAEASRRFLKAIDRECDLSEQRRMADAWAANPRWKAATAELSSPLLTDPIPIDQAWDRAIDEWRAAAE